MAIVDAVGTRAALSRSAMNLVTFRSEERGEPRRLSCPDAPKDGATTARFSLMSARPRERATVKSHMRICSFLPSATEIIYALGRGDSLCGVSHECDFPPDARTKPVVVRSRIDPAALSSREIDEAVRDLALRGENIYEIDEAALAAARPDLVITQRLCEVCAVSFEDVERAAARLDPPPAVMSLDPHGLGDAIDDILAVGRRVGADAEAHHAAFGLRARIDAVRRAVARAESAPSVACVEWLDPVIIAGHWIPEMVETAGARNVLAEPGAPSHPVELDALIAADPDAVILMPCGMDAARASAEFRALPTAADWRRMSAFAANRVYAVDSGALFSRSGPRLVDGLEILARIVHPDLFPDAPPDQFRVRADS